MSKRKLKVLSTDVALQTIEQDEFISITDIARYQEPARTDHVIQNWMRNRNTIEFLGIWERLNNQNFNPLEFEGFKKQAGLNSFVLTPSQWIEKTNAVGMRCSRGRYGGTFAHQDIAFEFASWVSVEFKLYLIKEFQRLKEAERQTLGWDVRRNLAKINYRIHTEAVQSNLIPIELTREQVSLVYASEADVLNMALFGMTARQWRDANKEKKGNIRDHATASQLVCLVNLEILNANWIREGIGQEERLAKLNHIAIQQMDILEVNPRVKKLGVHSE
jgi:hypothetical protein